MYGKRFEVEALRFVHIAHLRSNFSLLPLPQVSFLYALLITTKEVKCQSSE
jgi:hypothetical protein